MSEWWKGWPWRFIQTNLREIDMVDIDAERYVADLKEFRAMIAMINTSGIITSYPTKLPYHYQSPFLKGSSLADIITVVTVHWQLFVGALFVFLILFFPRGIWGSLMHWFER